LESEVLDQNIGDQIVKNMVFTFMNILKYPTLCEKVSSNIDEDEEVEEEREPLSPTEWLFRRLSYMARRSTSCIQRKCIFNFFAAVTTLLQPEDLNTYVVSMLHPLYRISMSEQNLTEEETTLKEFVEQVITLLREKTGSEFFKAYEKVRSSAEDKKQKRKDREKIQAVTDPELKAKRKIQKTQMRRNAKKRKIEEIKNNPKRIKKRRKNT